ncbi:MAG: tRNA (adenosine(37)-N6)-dimethylallyltransferase MiaA [Deltaproteobacteria bacterium]|nr:MAG: tRNA (adenosine(37)-N6)-dimethylallyltransferase MiaA [Deltaproteobacteria bacterium]
MDNKPKVVVIAGPTASGKTELAIELALNFNAEIINADSMQVYREMDIGTAKPTPEQRRNVPHHLIDVVYPDQEFNAARYREMALSLIHDINARGKNCLVVGGTGLYIKALLGGLFYVPPKDPELRGLLKREAEEKGLRCLYERLARYDPEYAVMIHPNDRIRIIRALEIYYLANKRPSELMREHGFNQCPVKALKIFLYIDRQELYDRINKRCIRMIESGLIEETKRLLIKGYSPELKPMQSIGYRHAVRYIKGEWRLERALELMQRDTRRYAKRQFTWFKKEPDMIWISHKSKDLTEKKVFDFLDK